MLPNLSIKVRWYKDNVGSFTSQKNCNHTANYQFCTADQICSKLQEKTIAAFQRSIFEAAAHARLEVYLLVSEGIFEHNAFFFTQLTVTLPKTFWKQHILVR